MLLKKTRRVDRKRESKLGQTNTMQSNGNPKEKGEKGLWESEQLRTPQGLSLESLLNRAH